MNFGKYLNRLPRDTNPQLARALADVFKDFVSDQQPAESKLAKMVFATDYGATGDGVTDDTAAVRSILSEESGGHIHFPAGTYNITLAAGSNLGSIGANTTISGDGAATTISITVSDTTFASVFGLSASHVTFENISISLSVPASGSAALFSMSGTITSLQWRHCFLSANIIAQPTSESYLVILPAASSTQSDVVFDDCHIYGWHYTVLKTNTDASTQRRWKVLNCYFYDNETAHWSPNSPAGTWDDHLIAGNTFGGQNGNTAGAGHHVGLSAVTHCRIIGNTFIGTTDGEAIHVEENCEALTIHGNTFDITSDETNWGDGIRIMDAAVSGARDTPYDISIVGNVIRRTGATDGVGIAIQIDASGQEGAERVIIEGNVIEGFERGIEYDTPSNEIRINNNIIRSCTTAIYFTDAAGEQCGNNSIISCTTGIQADGGGLVGKHQFRSVTTAAAASGGALALAGWSVSLDSTSLTGASTDTDVVLIPSGLRFAGQIRFSVRNSNTATTVGSRYLHYDGTTLTVTATNDVTYEPGALALTNFNISAGNLRIRVFNSGSTVGAMIQADFEGVHVFD